MREREVVEMYFLEQMPLKDIGQIMKVTDAMISQNKKKALAKLRKLFKENGYKIAETKAPIQ